MPNTINGPGSFSGAGAVRTELTYTIGQTGPGGGVVFYDAGSNLSWGRYIEVAPLGWSTLAGSPDPYIVWSGNTTQFFGGNYDTLGTGKTNFDLAIAQDSTPNRAITITKDYRGGGKDDWFIGNMAEYARLRQNYTSLPFGTYLPQGSPFFYTSEQGAIGSLYTSVEDFTNVNGALAPRLVRSHNGTGGTNGYVYKSNTQSSVRPMRYFVG